jgi:hypothetical protein
VEAIGIAYCGARFNYFHGKSKGSQKINNSSWLFFGFSPNISIV